MLEGLISLLIAVVEAVISFFAFIIEAIASLFMVAGETLTAGEALLIFFLLIFEVLYWAILWLLEIIKSLIQWRKPKAVPKPIFWRPKKVNKIESNTKEQSP